MWGKTVRGRVVVLWTLWHDERWCYGNCGIYDMQVYIWCILDWIVGLCLKTAEISYDISLA